MSIFIKALVASFIAVFLITSAGRIFLKPLTDPSYHTERNAPPPTSPVATSDNTNSGTPATISKPNIDKSSLTPGQEAAAGAGYSTELAAPGAQTGAPVQDQQ